MLFIECLENIMNGIDPVKNENTIKSKFKEKFPEILGFISGRPFIVPFFKLYIIKNKFGCLLKIESSLFDLTSINTSDNKEFKCDIDFKDYIDSSSIKNITCQFDDDLNIKEFNYRMNFGSFMSGNSFNIRNTKYFDGSHKRKIYLQGTSDHQIKVIENLNIDVNNEDIKFENILSRLFLINYSSREFYNEIFSYLPEINFKDAMMMSNFINQLHSVYISNIELIEDSFKLFDIKNI